MTTTSAPPFVHPLALCESDAVGAGTRIWPFAHVMEGATVGRACNIGEHAFVEAGVRLGDRVTVKNGVVLWTGVTVGDEVFLGPCAVFTNDLNPRVGHRLAVSNFVPTYVGRGASVGANATIVCGVTLGAYCMVGAGAVVTRDIPPHRLVVGNPARSLGWVCDCGLRLPADLICRCGLEYRPEGEGIVAKGESSQ